MSSRRGYAHCVSCLAKRMECVELAPAFGCATTIEPMGLYPNPITSDSGSKLHALHTLRDLEHAKQKPEREKMPFVVHPFFCASRAARPAPAKFASSISEYFRERMSPSAPALRAAATAA